MEKDPHKAGDDERIYQEARSVVIGQMQVITYQEFLPALLGKDAIGPYRGYNETVNASLSNLFSTVCYRLGHSMLSSEVQLGGDLLSILLRDIYFKPELIEQSGIEPFLLGLTNQEMQEIDTQIVEDVRSHLFGPPDQDGGSLLDLAALNIQRGRDHGLPDYNTCRADCGLPKVTHFAEITQDTERQQLLKTVYGDVDSIDPWIGGLAEDHLPGSNVGLFFSTVLKEQFERLRDGDRFWYEIDPGLSDEQKEEIKVTCLSDIILRNTSIEEIRQDVFRVAKSSSEPSVRDELWRERWDVMKKLFEKTRKILEEENTEQMISKLSHLFGEDESIIRNSLTQDQRNRLYVLETLEETSNRLFDFFYGKLLHGTPEERYPHIAYPLDYVLRVLLQQVSIDLDVIQRSYEQRLCRCG